MNKRAVCTALLLNLLIALNCFGQAADGSRPPSFTLPDFVGTANPKTAPTIVVEHVDLDKLYAERGLSHSAGLPAAVGTPVAIDVRGQTSPIVLGNGDKIWRLRFLCPGATSLGFYCRQFELPEGARLYFYNENHRTVKGAYTSFNNRPDGSFAVSPVQGDAVTLEYFEPAQSAFPGKLVLSRVYRGLSSTTRPAVAKNSDADKGDRLLVDAGRFDGSFPCHNNINCPKGSEWCLEARSVCVITLVQPDGDIIFCSGSLVNNTENDFTPYVLTAWHCLNASNPQTTADACQSIVDCELDNAEKAAPADFIFDFHYWSFPSDDCKDNGIFSEAVSELESFSGADLVAANKTSDFALLKIREVSEGGEFDRDRVWDYDLYFLGWTRTLSQPTSAVCIHHPAGDIMKISRDFDQLTTPGLAHRCASCEGSPVPLKKNDYWLLLWDTDEGTIEGGSSGAPILNQDHLLVGQLSRKSASECFGDDETKNGAGAGRFSVSWNSGSTAEERLKDHLDPNNTDKESIEGIRSPIYLVDRHFRDENYEEDFISYDPVSLTIHYRVNAMHQLIFDGITRFSNPLNDVPPGPTPLGATIRAGKEIVFKACTHIEPRAPLDPLSFVRAYIGNPPCEGEGILFKEFNSSPSVEVPVPRVVYSDPPPAPGCGIGGKQAQEEFTTQSNTAYDLRPPQLFVSPNPLSDEGTILIRLHQERQLTLELRDMLGRRLQVIENAGDYRPGSHRLSFNVNGLPSGIYVLALHSNDFAITKKIVVKH